MYHSFVFFSSIVTLIFIRSTPERSIRRRIHKCMLITDLQSHFYSAFVKCAIFGSCFERRCRKVESRNFLHAVWKKTHRGLMITIMTFAVKLVFYTRFAMTCFRNLINNVNNHVVSSTCLLPYQFFRSLITSLFSFKK